MVKIDTSSRAKLTKRSCSCLYRSWFRQFSSMHIHSEVENFNDLNRCFFSCQDAPSLSVYGSSLDSLKSDFEVELMEKLADAAVDISLRTRSLICLSFIYRGILICLCLDCIIDPIDSLTSSSCSGTITRALPTNNSMESMMPFPDTGDPTD